MAVTIAVMSLTLAAPFINILTWFGGLRWLTAYGVIVALAMVAVAIAVMLTIGLFRAIGPKRTRLCAQIVAAVIGASFAIGVQFAAILSYGGPSRVGFLESEAVIRYAPDTGSTLWWPARAILGDLPALAVVFSISATGRHHLGLRASLRAVRARSRRHLTRPDPTKPTILRIPQDITGAGITRQGMDSVATRSVAHVAKPDAIALPATACFLVVAQVL
jgi:hypothetical protein